MSGVQNISVAFFKNLFPVTSSNSLKVSWCKRHTLHESPAEMEIEIIR